MKLDAVYEAVSVILGLDQGIRALAFEGWNY